MSTAGHNAETSEPDARAQEVFARMLREQVAPTLRTWGFRGSGQAFELRDAKTWVVLGFQRSRYSRSDELEFTINVAVVGKDAWEKRRTAVPKLGRRPAPSDTVHAGAMRLDQIDPHADDVWWVVRPDTDTSRVSRLVLETIAVSVLPWVNHRLGRTETPTTDHSGDGTSEARPGDDEPLLV